MLSYIDPPMGRSLFFKLFICINIFVLLLFAALAFLAVPAADDFYYANNAVTHDPWYLLKFEYLHWAARYFQVLWSSVWFGYLLPVEHHYWLGLLLYISFFAFSIWMFVRNLSRFFGLERYAEVGAFLLFVALLRGMPTLDESIYWHIGSLTYIVSVSFFITVAAFCLSEFDGHGNGLGRYLLMAAMVIAGGGTLEVISPLQTLLFVFFIVAGWLNQRRDVFFRVGLVVSMLPFMAILLSPGKGARMQVFEGSGQLWHSAFGGMLDFLRCFAQTIIDPYLLIGLVFLFPLALKAYAYIRKRYDLRGAGLLYIALYFGGLYSIFALHYYATGFPPVQRLLSTWYVLLVLGLFALLVCMVPLFLRLSRYVRGRFGVKARIGKKYFLPIFAIYVISFLCINNPLKAALDLSGEAWAMRAEYGQMLRSIEEQGAQGDNSWRVLHLYNFISDPQLLKTPDHLDYSYGKYFGFRKAVFVDKEQ